jgi:hypothetical protein
VGDPGVGVTGVGPVGDGLGSIPGVGEDGFVVDPGVGPVGDPGVGVTGVVPVGDGLGSIPGVGEDGPGVGPVGDSEVGVTGVGPVVDPGVVSIGISGISSHPSILSSHGTILSEEGFGVGGITVSGGIISSGGSIPVHSVGDEAMPMAFAFGVLLALALGVLLDLTLGDLLDLTLGDLLDLTLGPFEDFENWDPPIAATHLQFSPISGSCVYVCNDEFVLYK